MLWLNAVFNWKVYGFTLRATLIFKKLLNINLTWHKLDYKFHIQTW